LTCQFYYFFTAIAEASSLQSLQAFITRSHELIILLQLVSSRANFARVVKSIDDDVNTSSSNIPDSTLQLLRTMHFEDICLSERGRVLGKKLASGLLKDSAKDASAVQALSHTLQSYCASYFTAQDHNVYRAKHRLEIEVQNPSNSAERRVSQHATINAIMCALFFCFFGSVCKFVDQIL
jgi:hypothetical protein